MGFFRVFLTREVGGQGTRVHNLGISVLHYSRPETPRGDGIDLTLSAAKSENLRNTAHCLDYWISQLFPIGTALGMNDEEGSIRHKEPTVEVLMCLLHWNLYQKAFLYSQVDRFQRISHLDCLNTLNRKEFFNEY